MQAEYTNENQVQEQTNASGSQPINTKKSGNFLNKALPVILVGLVIGAGAVTGLVLASANKAQAPSGDVLSEESLSPEVQENFSQTFSDEAEGVLEKNDEFDEYAQGPWKLIRPGGESQTAYLTSTTMDLDEFVGKEVKVYGETFGSSQVGWLMDVGKVEIIE